MKVLSAEAMAGVDQRAMQELGIPGMVLMENAAIGLADEVGQRWPQVDSVAIFCGPGNNGGDGLALGRHLAVRGYEVQLWLVHSAPDAKDSDAKDSDAKDGDAKDGDAKDGDAKDRDAEDREWRAGGDAGTQQDICCNMGLEARHLTCQEEVPAALEQAHDCGLWVDALFGTGLSRPLSGLFAALAEGLSMRRRPVLAVDLPSGFHGSDPDPLGSHVRADVTVTFATPKIAHVFPPASEAVGELVIADLGIPAYLLDEAEGDLYLLLPADLGAYLLPRSARGHKGDFGHAVLVAGAPGTAGAATLAARAAVRGGAGLVTAAVPQPLWPVVDGASLESMTLPLAHENGVLNDAAVDDVLGFLQGKQAQGSRLALAVGPGLGTTETTAAAIRRLVLAPATEGELPLVLDADGLTAFAGRLSELQARGGATVLTPHAGELARLLSGPEGTLRAADVLADRRQAVLQAAVASGCVVVLKGHRSLIATPEGELYVNLTGNPGMATGGTGDVLTGLLAGLLAQGYELLVATQLAVCLHGLAGDLAAEAVGEISLAAGDLLDQLPAAFGRLQISNQD